MTSQIQATKQTGVWPNTALIYSDPHMGERSSHMKPSDQVEVASSCWRDWFSERLVNGEQAWRCMRQGQAGIANKQQAGQTQWVR